MRTKTSKSSWSRSKICYYCWGGAYRRLGPNGRLASLISIRCFLTILHDQQNSCRGETRQSLEGCEIIMSCEWNDSILSRPRWSAFVIGR